MRRACALEITLKFGCKQGIFLMVDLKKNKLIESVWLEHNNNNNKNILYKIFPFFDWIKKPYK